MILGKRKFKNKILIFHFGPGLCFTRSSEFWFGVQRKNRAEPWFEVPVRSLDKGPGPTLFRQVRRKEKVPWFVRFGFRRKEWAKPWFGRFGLRRKDRAEPWFGRFGVWRKYRAEPWLRVWVQSSEKRLGRTLVRQVWNFEEEMG